MFEGQFLPRQPLQFIGSGAPAPAPAMGADCTLLLHADGADASTTITDSSPSALSATVVNNTQLDTAQAKFGASSILFDGADDYFRYSNPAALQFGTGAFTIDFWFRLNATGINQSFWDSRASGSSGTTNRVLLGYKSTGKVFMTVGGADRDGTTTISGSTWYHLALCKEAGTATARLFLNGILEVSYASDSSTYTNGTSAPVLGCDGNVRTSRDLNGWMDEIHVQKGTARWTANFTPPSKAYA